MATTAGPLATVEQRSTGRARRPGAERRPVDEIAAWRGRPGAVWTLALLSGVGSLLAAVGLLVPAPGRTMTAWDLALTVFGFVLTAWLWRDGARAPRPVLPAVLVVLALANAVLVARSVTGEGAVATSMGNLWFAIYAGVFFPPVVARLHLGLQAALLGGALTISLPTSRGLLAWLLVVSSSAIAAEVLARLHRRLRTLTRTDVLTGALNRSGLQAAFETARRRARAEGGPLSLAVLDLDAFKAVNDRDGHAAGDALLVEVVARWRAALRPGDRVARLGGDEFALLLPDADLPAAECILARLAEGAATPFTGGVAVVARDEDLDAALRRADAAMYARKHAPPDRRDDALRA
ncbi:GGDEF domain-containing protein [Nitriliruptoraceae bacterium ZYF776]|nr:GGDEF domain-containing protein [Profundirhabdus halotolerans]